MPRQSDTSPSKIAPILFHQELPMAEQAHLPLNVLRRKQVQIRTGLARSTIYEQIALGTFPKPIKLGSSRAVGWIESEIEAWLQSCMEKRK